MRSSLPKVLHPVCGRPMVAWPVLAAREAGAERVAVIVAPDRDLASGLPEGTETVIQPEADGTGGAVRAAHDIVRDSETVVVLSGDHPLINAEIVSALLTTHFATGAGGDGDDRRARRSRRLRARRPRRRRRHRADRRDQAPRRGARPRCSRSREINTGTYAFDAEPLMEALDRLDNDNSAGEYYLGDVLPMLREQGRRVVAHKASDPNVNLGVNNRADLALVTAEARRQILEQPHARRGDDRRPRARPGSTPTSRSRPTPRSSRGPRCAARPRSAATRSSARTRP